MFPKITKESEPKRGEGRTSKAGSSTELLQTHRLTLSQT